jgi:uncharacterized protein YggT (Ycf19 family)
MDSYERQTTTTDPATDPEYVPRRGSVTTEREVAGPTPSAGDVVRRAVAIVFGILQALLILRIVLLLLVANRDNNIVQLVLSTTDPFVEPFRGMFQLDQVRAGESKLDVAAIVALIGWTLIEALVVALLSLGARRGEDATA